MARIKTSKAIVAKNLETLVRWRSQKNIMAELDKLIRSDILFLTVRHLVKVEKAPTHQLAELMDQFGFISANTTYKFEKYIELINEKYDIPLAIDQGWIYINPEYKLSPKQYVERYRSRLDPEKGVSR